jgi:hypothetical protein
MLLDVLQKFRVELQISGSKVHYLNATLSRHKLYSQEPIQGMTYTEHVKTGL